jgi:hypothetical protein
MIDYPPMPKQDPVPGVDLPDEDGNYRCIDCKRPFPPVRKGTKQSKRCFLCRIEWVKERKHH